jgi:hypothetical protein
MDKGVAREIRLLEKAISIVMNRSKKLASKVDSSTDLSEDRLLEDLQQTAIALHYELEALKAKVYGTGTGLQPAADHHSVALTTQPTGKEKDES